jgi:tripartite-type tricarboxylate transporter receptor subunit TctC
MKLPRRHFLHLAAGAAALPVMPRFARAQVYPTRPVRLIVPFPAGGIIDIIARLVGQRLSERLGQYFIVDNRPGAGANIGTEAALNAPPDGYTLLLVSVANAVNATLYDRLNFNFIRDAVPIAGLLRGTLVMEVHPSVPANSVPEFIAYAKANPGKINLASAGNGTPAHMAGELFRLETRIDVVHVPYRGDTPALTDLFAGQVQAMFGTVATSMEHIRAGKLRPLAVTTSMRSAALPNVATVGEFLQGYEVSTWYGLSTPKNTRTEIIDRLNGEINAALADPKINVRFAELGGTPLPGSPADFGKFIADETEKWGKVIRAANIKPE